MPAIQKTQIVNKKVSTKDSGTSTKIVEIKYEMVR